ncbi:MAG: hypothetical protein IEMM0008_1876 [bacterium]|nr:MAG: hypothetical protein IEMM0008_1876 [bacterium]
MKLLIVFLVFLLASPMFSASEDLDLSKDLLLSDRDFEFKYIMKLKSVDVMVQMFHNSDRRDERVMLVKRLSMFLTHQKAFNLLIHAISNGIPSPDGPDPDWLVRASAIYLLGLNGKDLAEAKRLIILKWAADRFKGEKKPIVIASCAFTLVKLAIDPPDKRSSHKLFNKRKISYLFSERLLTLTPHENLLCSVLVKAIVDLGDFNSYLALSEMRKKPFHPKVLAQIQKAMDQLKRSEK